MFAQRKKHSVGIVFEKIVLLAQRKVSSVFERIGPITLRRHYLVKPSTDFITYVKKDNAY